MFYIGKNITIMNNFKVIVIYTHCAKPGLKFGDLTSTNVHNLTVQYF